jgi:DNA polymerase-3 subunit chi
VGAREVEFHTGVADKLDYACRLLRKAYRQGVRVVVVAPSPLLAALDRELWTFDERDFIPHLRLTGAGRDALAAATPIWLVDGDPPADREVLVNLGAPVPSDPGRWQRLIEIVSTEPDDLAGGRQRWREYLAAGLEPKNLKAGSPRQA